MRVAVRPELLRWACERAGWSPADLEGRFPQLQAWLEGRRRPTFRQLEHFAKVTRAPFGFFFLPEPPEERLPIPDLRTLKGKPSRPSPDLLETIYAMQRRQEWLRRERIEDEADPLPFVGSARISDDPTALGQEIRRVVGVPHGWAREARTWQRAIGLLRELIEELGILAVINGVVGNNTHRKLDVSEFRGFALSDPYAPLIFVNGADARSAQMFTLAHELAHIWLGPAGEGLSGFEGIFPGGPPVERFCNEAAAEFLVPAQELRASWASVKNDPRPFIRLARQFKVSPIVIGRRAMDLGLVSRETFFSFYQAYSRSERGRGSTGGGDFYRTQNARVGARFALRVIFAALEGRLSFREAYELTGLHGGAFQSYARKLGIDLP
jgi:Zn-dependent peptidase ImmA (M78 family)